MANILLQEQPYPFVGLGTLTFTVPTTGLYNVKCDSTEVPPSGLSIVVNVNAAPVYTAPVITPTQGALQFKTVPPFSLNAADIVTVVLSSASDIDNQLNTVKSIVSIGQGA